MPWSLEKLVPEPPDEDGRHVIHFDEVGYENEPHFHDFQAILPL